MAGVVGKVGSFATVDKVDDSIGQAFKDVNALYDASAEKRKKEEDAKKTAEQAKETAKLADLEKVKGVTSGKKGADSIVISSISKLSDKLSANYRALDSGQMSQTEFNIQKTNIFRQVDYVNQASKRTATRATAYEKDMMDGKFAPGFEQGALEYGNSLNNGNAYTEVDENGNLDLMLFNEDENGDRKILEKSNISTFGTEAFSGVLNFDYVEDLKNFIANNPMAVDEKFKGNSIVGKTEITPQIKSAIDSHVNSLLTDPNKLSIAYQQATGKAEENITDPAKIKIAKEAKVKMYEDAYNPKTEVKEALGRASHNLAVTRNNQEQKKTEVTTTQAIFDAQTANDDFDNDGKGKNIGTEKFHPNMVSVPGGAVKFSNIGGVGKEGSKPINNGYVTGFAIQKNGKVIVTGKAIIDKGKKFKVGNKNLVLNDLLNLIEDPNTSPAIKEEAQAELDSYSTAANMGQFVREVSSTELTDFARRAKLGTPEELKARLKKMNEETQETAQERIERLKKSKGLK